MPERRRTTSRARFRIAIVGAGRVGCTIGRLLADAGQEIVCVVSRTAASARSGGKSLGCRNVSTSLEAIPASANLVFIAVPHAAIEEVARSLARAGNLRFSRLSVCHASGIHTASALDALRERGATLFSFHPLQTFPRDFSPRQILPSAREELECPERLGDPEVGETRRRAGLGGAQGLPEPRHEGPVVGTDRHPVEDREVVGPQNEPGAEPAEALADPGPRRDASHPLEDQLLETSIDRDPLERGELAGGERPLPVRPTERVVDDLRELLPDHPGQVDLVDHPHLEENRPHPFVGQEAFCRLLPVPDGDHPPAEEMREKPVVGVVAGGENAAAFPQVERPLVGTPRDVKDAGFPLPAHAHEKGRERVPGETPLLIGAGVNLEAGAVLANHFNQREDKRITVVVGSRLVATGVEKFGAVVGDDSRIGVNAVTTPGTILLPRSIVHRLQLVDQVAGYTADASTAT